MQRFRGPERSTPAVGGAGTGHGGPAAVVGVAAALVVVAGVGASRAPSAAGSAPGALPDEANVLCRDRKGGRSPAVATPGAKAAADGGVHEKGGRGASLSDETFTQRKELVIAAVQDAAAVLTGYLSNLRSSQPGPFTKEDLDRIISAVLAARTQMWKQGFFDRLFQEPIHQVIDLHLELGKLIDYADTKPEYYEPLIARMTSQLNELIRRLEPITEISQSPPKKNWFRRAWAKLFN